MHLLMGIVAFTTAATVQAADAERSPFGSLEDGTAIEKVTLTNDNGMSVTTMTLGATLQEVFVPDRDGKRENVVLGYDSPAEYVAHPGFFGATVGRFANRIANGRFPLDGKTYQLETTGKHTLHGGKRGFDKRVWTIVSVKSGRVASVTYRYVSAAGEGGFPGTATVTATYSLGKDNALHIDYSATTDEPTIVNVTNHSYWSLSGSPANTSALGDLLTIDASAFTPVDETLIPTGEIRPVEGTPFDFRQVRRVDARIHEEDTQLKYARGGYDHNFVIDGKAGEMRRMARVEEPTSGRIMEVWSKAPGLQFFSGRGNALAFEPQLFPDAPNHPNFPSAQLDPGQTYHNAIIFKFSTTKSR